MPSYMSQIVCMYIYKANPKDRMQINGCLELELVGSGDWLQTVTTLHWHEIVPALDCYSLMTEQIWIMVMAAELYI